MRTEKIKQLKNTVWIVRFIDENGKVYIRFVSNSVVENWEEETLVEFSCNRIYRMSGSSKQKDFAFKLARKLNMNMKDNSIREKFAALLYEKNEYAGNVINFCQAVLGGE